MTTKMTAVMEKYQIDEKNIEKLFCEFIPHYDTKDITHLIYDYYKMTETRKEIYKKLGTLIGDSFKDCENISDNELENLYTFRICYPHYKFDTWVWAYCDVCNELIFIGFKDFNGFIHLISEERSKYELCNLCLAQKCACILPRIRTKNIKETILKEETKKCQLCYQLKCKKHFFTSEDDTVCSHCRFLFQKFVLKK